METSPVSRKRVLLVDDEQGVRIAVKLLLEALFDYDITEASNGREAVRVFSRDKFDLVITDYSMPDMKGNQLAVEIRKVAPKQPILMITAFADQLRGAENPVDDILNKPFSARELTEAIDKVLC
jgi:DNA-binding response OmpR family regulator